MYILVKKFSLRHNNVVYASGSVVKLPDDVAQKLYDDAPEEFEIIGEPEAKPLLQKMLKSLASLRQKPLLRKMLKSLAKLRPKSLLLAKRVKSSLLLNLSLKSLLAMMKTRCRR